jgi:hypothetical protein
VQLLEKAQKELKGINADENKEKRFSQVITAS